MVSLSLRKKASRDSFSPTTGDWATWYLFQLSRARLCGFVLAASAIIVLLAGNLSGREAQDAVPRSSKQEVTLPSSAASLAAAGSTGGSAFSELPLNSRWKYPIIWAAPFFSQSGYGAEAVSYITALLRKNLVSKDDIYIMQSGDVVNSGVVDQMDPEMRRLLEGQEYETMMRKLPPMLANRSVIVICHTFPTCWQQPGVKTKRASIAVSKTSKGAQAKQQRALLSQLGGKQAVKGEQAARQDPAPKKAPPKAKATQPASKGRAAVIQILKQPTSSTASPKKSWTSAPKDPPSCPCPSAKIKSKVVYTVGRSMFETESLPAKLASYARAMDEVLVPSQFNVDSFAASGVNASKLFTLAQGINTTLFHPGAEPLNLTATGFLVIGIDPDTGLPPQVPEERPQQPSHNEGPSRTEPQRGPLATTQGGPLAMKPTAASIFEMGGFGEKSIFGALGTAVVHLQQASGARSSGSSKTVSGGSSSSSSSDSSSSASSSKHHEGQAIGAPVDPSNGREEQALGALEELQKLASMHGRRSLQAARPAAAAATSIHPLSDGRSSPPFASAPLVPEEPQIGQAKPRARSAGPQQDQSQPLFGPAGLQLDPNKPRARSAGPQQDQSQPLAAPAELQQDQDKPPTRPARQPQDPTAPLARPSEPQQGPIGPHALPTEPQQEQSKSFARPEGSQQDPPARPVEPQPLNPFRFLSVFKWEDRKGWDILLRAYLKEFEPAEPVELHLVTHAFGAQVNNFPSFVRSAAMNVLSLKALPDAQMPRVYLHTQHISDAQFPSIYSSANCLVVPTHGEGWGRPQMEAMACGLPVITTNWSGVTAFMNEDVAYPIRIESIVNVSSASPGWFEGQKWAQPSLSHLRRLMREVVSDPQAAAARGEAARRHIEAHYSDVAVAREALTHFLRLQAVVERVITNGKGDL